MNTKAVRIHGKMDLRLDEVQLPEIGPDGVRIRVVSDSLCMSSYKAAIEGGEHKRVPEMGIKEGKFMGPIYFRSFRS